ncbi:beta-galactosidase large subunit [Saccharicrinis fermentans DSM 9555 = JCM 21142]|uniref:beta-galactosidase n=1 Tax=Saccharicrinis fermentans DSM 9555 = JCM 21142 TaxID=869213 RepID=W7YBT7_9BACT|nr:beta-galactosidase large subunit [Saccharicrinis fermentans DSM 9555 = JCM 21142]
MIHLFRTLTTLVVLCITIHMTGQDWKNINILQKNRLDASSIIIPASTVSEATKADAVSSSYYKLLNGQWSFKYSEGPQSRPIDFYKTDYDVQNWDLINVPATGNYKDMACPCTSITPLTSLPTRDLLLRFLILFRQKKTR